jgi:hypothetical protein
MWYKEKISGEKIVFNFEDGRTSLPMSEITQIHNEIRRGYMRGENVFIDFEDDHVTEIRVPYFWMFQKVHKKELIEEIQTTIEEYGIFWFYEVNGGCFEIPMLKTLDGLSHNIEEFTKNYVTVFMYCEKFGDDEITTYEVPYEKLSYQNLFDILEISEQYYKEQKEQKKE